MRFHYQFYQDLMNLDARNALKELGAKDKISKIPKIIVNSHAEMVEKLQEVAADQPSISLKALDAIAKIDRVSLYEPGDENLTVQESICSPYCFVAIPYHTNSTIASPHLVLAIASEFDLENAEKILEIGAGSIYNSAVFALSAKDNARVYSTETNSDLAMIAKNNSKKLRLEDRITVVGQQIGMIGSPSNAPYDRIFSTLALRTTEQVETLLNQLDIGGLLRISMARYGDVLDKNESDPWMPGMNIHPKNIHFKPDHPNNFARVTGYLFHKVGPSEIVYAHSNICALGPMIQESI